MQTGRWRVPGGALFAPAAWGAVPGDPARVQLDGEAVPGAVAYRIRRDDEDLVQIADTEAPEYGYLDSGLTAGRAYSYRASIRFAFPPRILCNPHMDTSVPEMLTSTTPLILSSAVSASKQNGNS